MFDTVELFLEKMKELAVVTVHKAVQLRNLYQLTQESDETTRPYVARVTATTEFQKKKSKCAWCGSPKHTQTNSESDRQKMCKAWGKVCEKCKKTNHFSYQCRSSPYSNTVVATVESPAALDNSEVGGITGYIFGINDATRAEHNSRSGTCSPPCSPPPWRTSSL